MPPPASVPALLAIELGNALRRARLRRGLTLRQMEVASGGLFKPSSVASYERGERKISVERLCDIAWFLSTDPGRLIGEAVGMAALRQHGEVVLDLRGMTLVLPDLEEDERRLVEERVLGRGVDARDVEGTAVISTIDLQRLAEELGRSPTELLSALGPAMLGSSKRA